MPPGSLAEKCVDSMNERVTYALNKMREAVTDWENAREEITRQSRRVLSKVEREYGTEKTWYGRTVQKRPTLGVPLSTLAREQEGSDQLISNAIGAEQMYSRHIQQWAAVAQTEMMAAELAKDEFLAVHRETQARVLDEVLDDEYRYGVG